MKHEIVWAVKNQDGILLWTIMPLRKEAIKKLERNYGMKWQELRRDYSVVKVKIEEATP